MFGESSDQRIPSQRRGGFRRRHPLRQRAPTQQLHAPVPVLDHRRAAFDPVAAVHVQQVLDLRQLRAMDMAADDALDLALSRRVRGR
jgi:hypothetical protein